MMSRSCSVRSRIADQIVVGLRRQPDHEIQLQVLETGGEDHLGGLQDLVVGDRLVDHAAQAIRSGLGRDRDRPLAAAAQQIENGRRQIVEAQRGRADGVAHLDQLGQDLLDLGVVAQRDRHQTGAVRYGCARWASSRIRSFGNARTGR